MKISTDYAGTLIDLSFWCKSRCFVCPKRQVRSRTHRDLLFRCKSRCFASKNRRWGLGPIETCKSGPKGIVLHDKNTQMRAGAHWDLSFWCKSRCFACIKWKVRSGTHRDLLIRCKSRGFACKIRREGLGPIETSDSNVNHAVLHAQNDRWGLGPIEIRYSGTKLDVLFAKTTDEGWNP